MKVITVAQLRQNPGPALAEVERGEEYAVLRYRSEIARLVPVPRTRQPVTAAIVAHVFQNTPVDAGWADDIRHDRDTDLGDDPWQRR